MPEGCVVKSEIGWRRSSLRPFFGRVNCRAIGKGDEIREFGLCRKALFELFAVKNLEVVFLKIFDSSKEGLFREGKPFWRVKFCTCEFKRANDVGGLEETIMRRFDSGDERSARGKDGKGFFEKFGKFGLTVVVIHFQGVIGREEICLGDKKTEHRLQKRVVDPLAIPQACFVNFKAGIGDVCLAKKADHAIENAAAFLSTKFRVFLFPTNERSCMDTKIPRKAHVHECVLDIPDVVGDVLPLIMENHAHEIKSRSGFIRVQSSRFVNEDTNVLSEIFHVQCYEKQRRGFLLAQGRKHSRGLLRDRPRKVPANSRFSAVSLALTAVLC